MDQEVKKISSTDKWMRIAYMLLFAVILSIVATWHMIIISVIGVAQFAIDIATGKPNKQLLSLSDSFTHYLYQIMKYLTFVTEEKPFPFGSWPKAKNHE